MTEIIDQQALANVLAQATPSSKALETILSKAASGCGLEVEEAAILLNAKSDCNEAIFGVAKDVNWRLHGKCITFYGVSYISDACVNQCHYCSDSSHSGYRNRKTLSPEEFEQDLLALLSRHPFKEVCFLTGEAPNQFGVQDLGRYLRIASRRYHDKIIINVPPMSVEGFGMIREAVPNRLHFRVFQETYDREIYRREHPGGPKANYDWRITAQGRALQAGFDEVGLGVLLGLNDGQFESSFEILAMVAHAHQLHKEYGVWPQSVSFPRIRAGEGLRDYQPPCPVTDRELVRFVSVARLALPQTKTIITSRENAKLRRRIRPLVNIEDFGARPGPGGNMDPTAHYQMLLPDSRSGAEVREEMLEDGYDVF